MKPLLSIVTINFNNAAGLKRTIESVRNQVCSDIEYILIDGKSNDRSLEIICNHLDIISVVRFEQDKGIYNAMNKGLKEASGEYIMFLNSGDFLQKEILLIYLVNKFRGYDVIYGNLAVIRRKELIIYESPKTIEFWKGYQHDLPFQPASIIKRKLYLENGLFDERYSISADTAMMMKIFARQSTSYTKVNQVITIFDETGISSKRPFLALYQRFIFIARFYPNYIPGIASTYLRMLQPKLFKI